MNLLECKMSHARPKADERAIHRATQAAPRCGSESWQPFVRIRNKQLSLAAFERLNADEDIPAGLVLRRGETQGEKYFPPRGKHIYLESCAGPAENLRVAVRILEVSNLTGRTCRAESAEAAARRLPSAKLQSGVETRCRPGIRIDPRFTGGKAARFFIEPGTRLKRTRLSPAAREYPTTKALRPNQKDEKKGRGLTSPGWRARPCPPSTKESNADAHRRADIPVILLR